MPDLSRILCAEGLAGRTFSIFSWTNKSLSTFAPNGQGVKAMLGVGHSNAPLERVCSKYSSERKPIRYVLGLQRLACSPGPSRNGFGAIWRLDHGWTATSGQIPVKYLGPVVPHLARN